MSHAVQGAHGQSPGQLLQSSQPGSQKPLPQSGWHMLLKHVLHGPHPQSDGQLPQFSHNGSHIPSPQAGWHTPITQFSVHGSQPQSPGQVVQFSQAGLQNPSPQVPTHTPPTHASMQGSQPQSSGQVSQSSSQLGSQTPSPQTSKQTLVFVIVQTILVAWEPTDTVREVQFVQLPTGVGVRSQVPAPCAEQVALTRQVSELFPVHRPAVSTQEILVL